MNIDDIQAEKIAKAIIYDINNYILEHQAEYNNFLKTEKQQIRRN